MQHLDAIDPALVPVAAGLMASAPALVAATATGQVCGNTMLAPLVDRFAVIVDVPPLRERAADIPALVAGIIGELRPGQQRPRGTRRACRERLAGKHPPASTGRSDRARALHVLRHHPRRPAGGA